MWKLARKVLLHHVVSEPAESLKKLKSDNLSGNASEVIKLSLTA
jgi:hypothetical protein